MNDFPAQLKTKLDECSKKYESKRSAIIPMLHLIQDLYGWISDDNMHTLARNYNLNIVHIKEAATFYSVFRLKPAKKINISYCNNLVCHMMGAKNFIKELKIKIKEYEQKLSRNISVNIEGVPCLGVCDGAPAAIIDKDRYLKINKKNIDEILSKYIENA